MDMEARRAQLDKGKGLTTVRDNKSKGLTVHDKKWADTLSALLEYKSKNGHTLVPAKYGHLGGWVQTQRKAYKTGRLGADRIDKLNGINFLWSTEVRSAVKRPDFATAAVPTCPLPVPESILAWKAAARPTAASPERKKKKKKKHWTQGCYLPHGFGMNEPLQVDQEPSLLLDATRPTVKQEKREESLASARARYELKKDTEVTFRILLAVTPPDWDRALCTQLMTYLVCLRDHKSLGWLADFRRNPESRSLVPEKWAWLTPGAICYWKESASPGTLKRLRMVWNSFCEGTGADGEKWKQETWRCVPIESTSKPTEFLRGIAEVTFAGDSKVHCCNPDELINLGLQGRKRCRTNFFGEFCKMYK